MDTGLALTSARIFSAAAAIPSGGQCDNTMPKRSPPSRPIISVVARPFATEASYGQLMHSGYAGAPNVRLIPVEPSYHFIMLDQPAAFEAALMAFVG